MADVPSAWAACNDDAARIELFNRWLKSRRPLPSEDARHAAFRLRASLVGLDEEARIARGEQPPVPPCRTPPRTPPRSPPASPKTPKRRELKHQRSACAEAYSVHDDWDDIWIFGYGSILWRQGFAFERSIVGYVKGHVRRFHLADAQHRGTSKDPGRAVMLEQGRDNDRCWGCAFLLPTRDAARILETMDVRESAYEKRCLDLYGRSSDDVPIVRDVVAYVCPRCPARSKAAGHTGETPVSQIASIIASARGPSGRNVDYLYRLDGWLLQHGIRDDHVRAIAKLVHEREEAEEESRVCEDEPCAAAQGRVVVDDGAAEVVSNCGRSLLAVGVVRVVGDFDAGAHVAVVSVAGAAIAAGRTAYAASDLRALAGKRSRCCAELRPRHSGEPGVVIRKVDMVLS